MQLVGDAGGFGCGLLAGGHQLSIPFRVEVVSGDLEGMEHELAALPIDQSSCHGTLDLHARLANGMLVEERRDWNLGKKRHGWKSTPRGLAPGIGGVVEVA